MLQTAIGFLLGIFVSLFFVLFRKRRQRQNALDTLLAAADTLENLLGLIRNGLLDQARKALEEFMALRPPVRLWTPFAAITENFQSKLMEIEQLVFNINERLNSSGRGRDLAICATKYIEKVNDLDSLGNLPDRIIAAAAEYRTKKQQAENLIQTLLERLKKARARLAELEDGERKNNCSVKADKIEKELAEISTDSLFNLQTVGWDQIYTRLNKISYDVWVLERMAE